MSVETVLSELVCSDRSVTPHDFPQLDTLVKKIVGEKQPFERLEMKKEDLLKMFEVFSQAIVGL